MKFMRRRWIGFAGLLAAACGGQPTAPAPAILKVVLTNSAPNLGAVLLEVRGGSVDSVESAGYQTYAAPGRDSTLVIVTGAPVNGGVLVRLWVPDIKAAAGYSARVSQAAAQGTFTILGPSGLTLSVQP